ncbi:MAG TPA: glycosyltransferase family 2 protein [Candidatus Acidoferrum sp.]|nr:glycosyltransferase family 2 protein [Candidatus Acidoferrum sp.]
MLKMSIVTPSYNQAKFLEEALLSVKQQSYPVFEHIVMDGGSTDGSVEILRDYGARTGWKHLRWKSEPDDGQSDAVNKGFRVATGDVVGWLNSDDRYRPECFRIISNAFKEYPKADVLYGDYTYIDETGRIWRIRREIEFNQFILLYLHMLYVPTPSSFFRREIFDQGNWIDTKFHYAMDYEFILRLARSGHVIQHIPALLADFRIHPESKTGAHPDKQREEHDAIGLMYSERLRGIRRPSARRTVRDGLRLIARALRFKEKLLRGYYLEQFRPSCFRSLETASRLALGTAESADQWRAAS